jgi:catechol 2,3-dioxygenase-like lactoylglutathione lyase family enzyme
MMNPSQALTLEMKLEIVVLPVSNVDRAKRFYGSLGWRLDADFAFDDGFRVIQFTPPGSGASVIFGTNVTAAAPGSAKGLYLCQSACKFDPSSASNFDPFARRGLLVALVSSELAGIAEARRARVA